MFKLAAFVAVAATLVVLASAKPFPPVWESLMREITPRQTDVSYRLPNETHPVHYKIQLWTRVDLEDFDFTGSVEITLDVDRPTRAITIHARKLTVNKATLYKVVKDDTAVEVEIQEPTWDEVTNFLVITTTGEQLITTEQYKLVIEYQAVLRNDEAGFYRAWYTTDQGERR